MQSFRYDYVHLLPSEQIDLHVQDTWELAYIVMGAGMKQIGDTSSPFASGDLILIPPGIPHCFTFNPNVTDAEGKITNICLFFSRPLMERCQKNFPELSPVIDTICRQTAAVSFTPTQGARLISELEEMHPLNDVHRVPHVLHLLCLLAEEIERLKENSPAQK